VVNSLFQVPHQVHVLLETVLLHAVMPYEHVHLQDPETDKNKANLIINKRTGKKQKGTI